jgi:hypothetical protein
MSQPPVSLTERVLHQLSTGESRILSLVVAVRRTLAQDEHIKGNLTDAVKACLQKLVASSTVIQVDGMFSLAPAKPVPELPGKTTSATSTEKPLAMGEDW